MPRINIDIRQATDRGNRHVRAAWGLWRRCPNRRCRRARACTGDVAKDPRCNGLLSREEQAWLNGVSLIVGVGGTTEQVIEVGTLAVQSYRQMREVAAILREGISLMRLTQEHGGRAER